jgi:hypothetical protein
MTQGINLFFGLDENEPLGIGNDWTVLLPESGLGNDIAITGSEGLEFEFAAPVYSAGYDFAEPTVENVTQTFQESTFSVEGLDATDTVLFSFNWEPDNDVAEFIGVWSNTPFVFLRMVETVGGSENEFYGPVYSGASAPVVNVPGLSTPGLASLLLLVLSLGSWLAVRRHGALGRA